MCAIFYGGMQSSQLLKEFAQWKKHMALIKKITEKIKTKKKVSEKLTEKKAVVEKPDIAIKSSTTALYSSILKQAHVTEKSTHGAANSHYVFNVSTSANKNEIIKAVFALYGIKPVSVNVMRVKGKKIRFGKISGTRKNTKKAIVTLPKGKKISLYEGV